MCRDTTVDTCVGTAQSYHRRLSPWSASCTTRHEMAARPRGETIQQPPLDQAAEMAGRGERRRKGNNTRGREDRIEAHVKEIF